MLDEIRKKVTGLISKKYFYAVNKKNDAFITQVNQVKLTLSDFIESGHGEPRFISLGENCSSAWYLKQVNLKKASYPFDWVFSSPEIILNCINDKFDKFLDRKLMSPEGQNSAGHLYYHSRLFNHRSPLKNEADYVYYQRCCQRFLHDIKSDSPTCYVITLINEPTKRHGWSSGFTNHFKMPVDQDYKSISPLIKKLVGLNNKCQFIIIDHYTNRDRHVTATQIETNIMLIKYSAKGSSTGVFYQDPIDDTSFKAIMGGLAPQPTL